jgi:hypothetical protein
MSHRSFLRHPTKFFDERVESVLTVASIDQRATTPGASHAPGVVDRTGLPDSAAGLRDDGQPSGCRLRSTWPSTPERASAPPPPLRHPERAFAPSHWPAPATEHRDRATTPEASSPRPRDCGRDRTVGQLGPRADGQPGWLDGERRQRPPSYRGTTATLPPLPANSRTPPAVVATEGVHAGQAHSKERSEPARRYVSSPRPCPVPPTLPQLNGGPRGPFDPWPRSVATRMHGYLVPP